MSKFITITIFSAGIMLLLPGAAIADPFPVNDTESFFNLFDRVFRIMSEYMAVILDSGSSIMVINGWMRIILTALSGLWIMLGYYRKTQDHISTLLELMMISIIAGSPLYYDAATTEFWTFFSSLTDDYQYYLTGDRSRGSIMAVFFQIAQNIDMQIISVNPAKILLFYFFIGVIWILLAVNLFGVAMASVWGIFIYIVMKLIGILFIPFASWSVTRGLFFNWFRIFIGGLLFFLLARIFLLTVYIMIVGGFGYDTTVPIQVSTSDIPVYTIVINEAVPYGLIIILLTGIVSFSAIAGITNSLLSGGVSLGRDSLRSFRGLVK